MSTQFYAVGSAEPNVQDRSLDISILSIGLLDVEISNIDFNGDGITEARTKINLKMIQEKSDMMKAGRWRE